MKGHLYQMELVKGVEETQGDYRHQIKDKNPWVFHRTKQNCLSIPAMRSFCEVSNISPLFPNLVVLFGLYSGLWSGEQ